MTGTRTRSYGLWDSPITAESLAHGGLTIEPNFAFSGREIYFVERRPGRSKEAMVALNLDNLAERDILSEDYGVRSLVHEYGGLAFGLCDEGVVFTESGCQDVMFFGGGDYRVLLSGDERRRRFGDYCYDNLRHRWLAVAESHDGDEVRNELWFIGLEGGEGGSSIAVSGADFYASPCVSPNGKHCAWLQWDLPYMAWDRAALWQADIGKDGALCNLRHIAGGVAGRSCFQPQYDSSGNLFFICDNSDGFGDDGFWQLHCLPCDADAGDIIDFPLRDEGVWVECGLPLWQLGMRVYDFAGDDRILLAGVRLGEWGLYVLDIGTKEWVKLSVNYCAFGGLRCYGGRGYFLASHVAESGSLVELDIDSGECRVLKNLRSDGFASGYISRGKAISFSVDGGEAYGYYYAPCNVDFAAGVGELPPVIMRCHGGPTAAVHCGLNEGIQFWTSRGFAVCDLNYRGSTGFGRGFRESLYGQWGRFDVEDCVSAAHYLVSEGLVDGGRLIISGSSAGGFSALCVLAFSDVFAMGCSKYGIGDLLGLAETTHKFESGYLDLLVGGGDEEYRLRSPYYSAGGISCPVFFLQGSDDRVVPKEQMFGMVEVLRGNGVDCDYILFEGEGHGFRDSENIVRAYEGELNFFLKFFIVPL